MKIVDVVNKLSKHDTKTYSKRPLGVITTAVIHHSLTRNIKDDGDIYAFARYHVNNNGWPGIGYHYVIDTDGTIYKTNYLTTKAYHVGNHNFYCIGLCLVGDFRTDTPTNAQLKSLNDLLMVLYKTYHIKIKGHSEMPGYQNKQCPSINMDKIRSDFKRLLEVNGYNTVNVNLKSEAEGKHKEIESENVNQNLLTIITQAIKNLLSILFKRS